MCATPKVMQEACTLPSESPVLRKSMGDKWADALPEMAQFRALIAFCATG
jgi:hypothetical protein